jgi:hypothetical protein
MLTLKWNPKLALWGLVMRIAPMCKLWCGMTSLYNYKQLWWEEVASTSIDL